MITKKEHEEALHSAAASKVSELESEIDKRIKNWPVGHKDITIKMMGSGITDVVINKVVELYRDKGGWKVTRTKVKEGQQRDEYEVEAIRIE